MLYQIIHFNLSFCSLITLILLNKQATVNGQTHPGTGLIAQTLSFTFSKFISHTAFPSKIPYQTSISI
jgi:hypothetical protein